MNILLDANVLLRLTDPTSATHRVAAISVSSLRAQGETLHVVPQSIYEFWVVATRPISYNGLGLSPTECVREVARLEASFPVLDDKATLFTEWRNAVAVFACQGKLAHDARYIAAMRTHGLTHLLTFNVRDFARYPGITVLDPNTVAAIGPANQPP